MTDKERFFDICRLVSETGHRREGIGTLGEKTVHYALKIFFEQREEFREVPVGKYVADIKNESGITEIQTSCFGALKRKLEDYLFLCDVNIVYPVTEEKRVFLISKDSGEVVKEYKSPKHERPAEIFKELLYLGDSLYSPRLSFTVVSISSDEILYDKQDGKRRRGVSYKIDKLPRSLLDVKRFGSVYEMGVLMPFNEGDEVTADMVCKFLHAKGRNGWAAVRVMEEIGYLVRIGKKDRKELYKFIKYPAMKVD